MEPLTRLHCVYKRGAGGLECFSPGGGKGGIAEGTEVSARGVGRVVFFGAKYPGDLFPPTPLPGLSQQPAE